MSHLTSVDALPSELQDEVAGVWQRMEEQATAEQFTQLIAEQQAISRFWAQSPLMAQMCCQSPDLLLTVLRSESEPTEWTYSNYLSLLQAQCSHCQNETELSDALRAVRRQVMCRIAWRDLMHHADLQQTITELSAFADAVINFSLSLLDTWLSHVYGVPRNRVGERQELIVIAVGKLGSQELNFSSDIDLIFSYPDPGNTQGGDKTLANETYFIRLAQNLIKLLQQVTSHGFVFRVDMRLRPNGDGGPLVMHLPATRDYYQEQGRDWERYALIKARVVTTDPSAMSRLLAIFKPFVYRRYIDYGAIESLRQMKQLIERDVKAKGLRSDIKRGPGGIRQIEFIGQVFQLIRGGQDRRLQQRKILSVLRYLQLNQILTPDAVDALSQAYIFLRNVEHRLQMVADRQTHMLPTDNVEQLRLAYAMDFANWEAFNAALSEHRKAVQKHFDALLAMPQPDQESAGDYCLIDCRRLWLNEMPNELATELLDKIGFKAPERCYELLKTFSDSHRVRHMDPQAHSRLDALMPQLIQTLGKLGASEKTVVRLLQLLESIVRRSVYLVLLLEHPQALQHLIELFAASPWIADRVSEHPFLLDDCLRLSAYTDIASENELEDELRQTLLSIPEQDLEEQMEALRRFKLSQLLRVAVLEISHKLTIDKVSKHLTFTAMVILRQVQEIARKFVTTKYLAKFPDAELLPIDFAIVAYGKLGGAELNYDSDLDLVFLHGGAKGHEELALRLAQRIIHILNMRTATGILYQVDTRLRPSGSAGLLVSSLAAFAEYQQQQAWTWEHQALVRARMISGSDELQSQFSAIRQQILAKPRDLESLRKEVKAMRLRMRDAVKQKSQLESDIKQCKGGLTDIEFIIQFGVLAWSHKHPQLLGWTDGARILDQFAEENIFDHADLKMLYEAYQYYRIALDQRILNNKALIFNEDEAMQYRQHTSRLWRKLIMASEKE